MKSKLQQINDRGHYNGWAAQELHRTAKVQNTTMAKLFTVNATAFNVPAKAVKVTSTHIDYVFLDGSKTTVRVEK